MANLLRFAPHSDFIHIPRTVRGVGWPRVEKNDFIHIVKLKLFCFEILAYFYKNVKIRSSKHAYFYKNN